MAEERTAELDPHVEKLIKKTEHGSYACPYCAYTAKRRGFVRKHVSAEHPDVGAHVALQLRGALLREAMRVLRGWLLPSDRTALPKGAAAHAGRTRAAAERITGLLLVEKLLRIVTLRTLQRDVDTLLAHQLGADQIDGNRWAGLGQLQQHVQQQLRAEMRDAGDGKKDAPDGFCDLMRTIGD